MDDIGRAYLAGIIDGEGTVSLLRKRPNETPSPSISIANANLPLLKWVKKYFGGCISTKRKYQPHHRQTFVWCLTHNKALTLLGEIQEFLIIKKPQAHVILNEYKKKTVRTGKYTKKQLAAKMKLVARVRKLNQREFMPPIKRRALPINVGR